MRSKAAHLTGVLLAFLTLLAPAAAQEVSVVALFPDKALLIIDKGKPRSLRAGESYNGITLISASSEEAVISIRGKRQKLRIGEGIYAAVSAPVERSTVTLIADQNGHFLTTGSINGATMKFLVDTGATLVSMSVDDARRAGVNYLAGERGYSQTANGVAKVYKVKLNNLKLGDITLSNIDGLVHESSALPVVLLGMSVLGQLEMKRDGDSLTLSKRY